MVKKKSQKKKRIEKAFSEMERVEMRQKAKALFQKRIRESLKEGILDHYEVERLARDSLNEVVEEMGILNNKVQWKSEVRRILR